MRLRKTFLKPTLLAVILLALPGLAFLNGTAEQPKVLLIGDSISIGYLPFVQELMEGKVLVDRIPLKPDGKAENCQGTTNGIANIDRWLGDTKWDVIHFNFGLHDIKHVNPDTGKSSNDPNDPQQANLKQYRKNLKELVGKLKATGANLIFATTTPYPEGTKPYREFSDVAKYNKVARKIMKKNKIAINDLHSFVLPRMEELQRPVNVHFTAEGSKQLAAQVVKSINNSLKATRTAPSISAQKANKLSKAEKKAGWTLLFNGKNFDGWRQCNGTEMPANWVLEDKAMKVLLGAGKKPGQGSRGDILFSDKQFKNFELSIDWKASKSANSGIFYYVRETAGKPIYYAAPEIQVLDNEQASDNKIDSHLAGSLYDMIPANPKTVNPAGEWNTCVIKVKDGKVQVSMNGTEVVSYSHWTPEWDELVQNSKFKKFKGFTEGISKEGYIGLQDHGYPVWFRNIKIREL